MKKGDLIYLFMQVGSLKRGDYELLSSPNKDGTFGDDVGWNDTLLRVMIYDNVAGIVWVPLDSIITMGEKKRRERNKKINELGL